VTSPPFQRRAAETSLLLAVGRDVTGQPVLGDLARMPHLLIAGTTGSGKSVCLHAVLASLLYQNSPATLQLVIVDPKRVELARYKGLPHLVAPVVTEVAECIAALKWAVAEMDRRYRLCEAAGVRDRAGYNARQKSGAPPLPALVLVIDELADLMLTAPEETEPLLARLAQLGRAAGIHLVVATQRPSTDVVTGLLKANFPARIAFSVASGIDSRVILDQSGAEALLGRGDLLFQPPDAPQPVRAQGVYVSDLEVARLVDFWSGGHWRAPTGPAPWAELVASLDPEEALFAEAVKLCQRHGRLSASFLQRKLHLGYARARELFERLQDEGYVDEDGRTGLGDDGEDERGADWVDQEFGGV
jgi:S-DNA-T family DNA segregation ATPase FtsK/SpoIIIE